MIKVYKSDSQQVRQAKKTFKQSLKRKRKKVISSKSNRLVDGSVIRFEDYIEAFYVSNKHLLNIKRLPPIIKVTDDFSLFDNPNKVLHSLLHLLFIAKARYKRAVLSCPNKISFSALYLIDNMCFEIAKKRGINIRFAGISGTDKAIFSKLRSIDSESYETDDAYMINERVRINRKEDPMAVQTYRVKSKEIRDMVEGAIQATRTEEFTLPLEAQQAIDSAISEHFDNIVLHVPSADSAYLCGFYDKVRKEITILIFNFGNTIAKTLGDSKLPDSIVDEVNLIISSHTKKKYFTQEGNFTKENALTLLALQEGISSKLAEDKTRGHGLIDYIEHCFSLNNDSKVVIISGNTSIKIDNKYSIGIENLFGRERKIIALNDGNDIFQRPDKDYVKNLNVSFPGVIIETTIPLEF